MVRRARALAFFAVLATAAAPRAVEIPWEYKGFQSFPACWFGANPTGSPAPGTDAEPNTTMAIMARHQLVGWGWQQGMYDFPCNKLTAEASSQVIRLDLLFTPLL